MENTARIDYDGALDHPLKRELPLNAKITVNLALFGFHVLSSSATL
jgi:hypothetical protein